MTVLIEAEAKEIAELLTLAVSNERLIEEKIRQIVNEKLNKQAVQSMKATYPPELWKALQEEFPCLKSDSHE